MTFDEFGFEDEIMDGLDAMNFKEATPVQEATIPVVLEGKDRRFHLAADEPYVAERYRRQQGACHHRNAHPRAGPTNRFAV